jgi:SEL1 protein
MCGVSVAWYKLVAEKGDWTDPYIREADRAYLRGEEKKAVLGWWIAAELGYEAGQNNVAFYLSKNGRAGNSLEWFSEEEAGTPIGVARSGWKEKEVGLWVRSAAQDNVDAMVKVGDYFCELPHGQD